MCPHPPTQKQKKRKPKTKNQQTNKQKTHKPKPSVYQTALFYHSLYNLQRAPKQTKLVEWNLKSLRLLPSLVLALQQLMAACWLEQTLGTVYWHTKCLMVILFLCVSEPTNWDSLPLCVWTPGTWFTVFFFFNISVIWYVYFFINDLITNFIQRDALL